MSEGAYAAGPGSLHVNSVTFIDCCGSHHVGRRGAGVDIVVSSASIISTVIDRWYVDELPDQDLGLYRLI